MCVSMSVCLCMYVPMYVMHACMHVCMYANNVCNIMECVVLSCVHVIMLQ